MEKILHIIVCNFYVEGAGYQENLLPRAHKQQGYDVTIVTKQYYFDGSGKALKREVGSYVNQDGIKVITLKETAHMRGLDYFRRKTSGLYSAIDSIAPDIIFMHGSTEIDSLDVVRYVKSHPSVKLYVDQHGDYYNCNYTGILGWLALNLVHKPIVRYVSKYAIKMWGTTPWRVQFLQDMYGVAPQKTDLLIMGADESQIHWEDRTIIRSNIRKKYNISDDDFLIVTGGKINEAKNIHLLVEAVIRLNLAKLKLLIFGQPDAQMQSYFNNISSPNIIQLGWIDSLYAYDVFLSADLACFPGTHSVLWEQAVACGLPSIFKLWDGMRHVKVNENAILLPEVSADTLMETIESICSSQDVYNTMKRDACAIRNQFNYSVISKRAIGK